MSMELLNKISLTIFALIAAWISGKAVGSIYGLFAYQYSDLDTICTIIVAVLVDYLFFTTVFGD